MTTIDQIGLCNLFRDQAQWVWRRLGQAKVRNFMFSETTITELLLLDLQSIAPNLVSVVPFKPAEERRNGADWQWCFTDYARSHFTEVRVQAKRLYGGGRYRRLLHEYQSGNPRYQMNRFIAEADAASIPPIYIFYNHLDTGRIPYRGGTNVTDQWGCSYAMAVRVRGCIKRSGRGLSGTSFSSIGRVSKPWHELVCRGTTISSSAAPSLPERVASLIRSQANEVSAADRSYLDRRARVPSPLLGEFDEAESAADFFVDGLGSKTRFNEFYPTTTPPPYLELLDTPKDPATGYQSLTADQQELLKREVGDVLGAIVIREGLE